MLEASDLPGQAGDFVVRGGSPADDEIRACGTRRSLAELVGDFSRLTGDGAQLFVRLNVNRATRRAEHEDLLDALQPSFNMLECD